MEATFSEDTGELRVYFYRGELEGLKDDSVTGELDYVNDPGAGSLEVVYDETSLGSRPLVGRESEGSPGDFQVVIEEEIYGKLVEGEVYSSSVGRYNSVPRNTGVTLVPEDAERY